MSARVEDDADRAELALSTVTMLDVFEVLSQVESEAESRVLTPGAAARRMAHLLRWRAAKK